MFFLIIILIISQLISFYLIILLNAKIAKFKDLEVRQEQLIREMDDAISVYLIEMREENDRLIKELSKVNQEEPSSKNSNFELKESLERSNSIDIISTPSKDVLVQPKTILPNIAKKAYQQQKNIDSTHQKETIKQDTIADTFENKVLELYKIGKTIEEIAKETNKGKTEIELLLKFHS